MEIQIIKQTKKKEPSENAQISRKVIEVALHQIHIQVTTTLLFSATQ